MEKIYYVYGLRCPNIGLFRYIGATYQLPEIRFQQHLQLSEYNPGKNTWLKGLMLHDKIPELVILYQFSTREEAAICERNTTEEYKEKYGPGIILNISKALYTGTADGVLLIPDAALLQAFDRRSKGEFIHKIAEDLHCSHDFLAAIFRGVARKYIKENWEKANGPLPATDRQKRVKDEVAWSFFELHFLQDVSIVEIAKRAMVSREYVDSVLLGKRKEHLYDTWFDLYGNVPERNLEKKSIPILDSKGNIFYSIEAAAKQYDIHIETVLRSLKAERPVDHIKVQFWYNDPNIVSKNQIKAETDEEKYNRQLGWAESGRESMANLRQNPEWESARITAIKEGIKEGQRSETQTERMKDPANREQISQTMTGRKYAEPRRTRAVKCSDGRTHNSILEAAKFYGVHSNSIIKALTGKRKTNQVKTKNHGVVAFSYVDQS